MAGMGDVVENMTVMDGRNELERIHGRYGDVIKHVIDFHGQRKMQFDSLRENECQV